MTSNGDDGATPDSRPAPTEADVEAALVEAYDSFDPDDIDAEIARAHTTERAIDLAMAKETGLEDALGGPEATAKAFAALDEQFASLGDELSAPMQLGLRRQASAGSGVMQGMVGGVIIVGLGADGAVNASNDGTTGTSSSNGVTVTVTDDKIILDIDVTHTAEGLTSRLKTHVELNPCPDTDGVITLKAKVDVTSKAADGAGQSAVLDVDVIVQVNDDARISGTDDTFRMRRSGLTGNSFWDVTVTGGVGGTSARVNDFNWFTGEMQDRDDTVRLAAILGGLIKQFMVDAARKGFESGRCIDLQVTADPGPNGLEPDSTSTLTAMPRGKHDGAPVGGTVTAELTGGTTKVEPSGTKVDADATFTFTAPDDVDLTGTVHFESRSRRGVGKKDLTLDTKQECLVGDWTMDNDSMTAILGPMAAGLGGSMRASGGPLTTHFADDGTLTHNLNGLTIITDVPNGTMTTVYSGSDTGKWKRRDDGSYVITAVTTGVTVNSNVSVGGMSMQVPANYVATLQPDVAMTCKDDQVTVHTAYGPVTLTRVD